MTEKWLPIPDFPRYQVSDYGRVRATLTSRLRKIGRMFDKRRGPNAGHCTLYLWKSRRRFRKYVHHLVLKAFVGPCPPGMECRHLDGDPTNNRLDNLQWGTRAENVADMIRHGTHVPYRGKKK